MASHANYRHRKSQNKRRSNESHARYEANRIMMNEKNYLCSCLLLGFLRPILTITNIENEYDLFKWISKDIEELCCTYFNYGVPKLSRNPLKLTKLSRKTNIVQIYFDDDFFNLHPFEQRLACRDILLHSYRQDPQYKTININIDKKDKQQSKNDQAPNPNQHKTGQTTHYLAVIEYMLSMHHNKDKRQIKKLNLSNMHLDDEDIWYLCKLIRNITNYQQSLNGKSWFLDLEEIDLSNNWEITDKYLHLLSQRITKCLPKLILLNLKDTSITNKSIPFGLLRYHQSNKYYSSMGVDTLSKQKKRKKKKYKSGNWMS